MKGGGAGAGHARRARRACARRCARSGIVRRLRPRAVLSVGGYAAGPATLAAAAPRGAGGRARAEQRRRARQSPPRAVRAARLPRLGRGEPELPREHGPAVRRSAPARASSPRPYVATRGRRARPRDGRQPGRGGRSTSALPRGPRPPRARGPPGRRASPGRARSRRRRFATRTRAPGSKARAWSPFIDDVAQAIADADLVVARAGAGTIAEIAADRSRVGPRALSARRRRPPGAQRRGARARGRVRLRPAGRGPTPRAWPPRSARLLADDVARRAMAERGSRARPSRRRASRREGPPRPRRDRRARAARASPAPQRNGGRS